MMDYFSNKIDIKDSLLIKLILKKARIYYLLNKPKESEISLKEAEDLLDVFFFNLKIFFFCFLI